jgi:hypothetical protein
MTVFLRVTIIATIAFVVVEALPLAWLNFVLCWAIIVIAAYRYPHMILAKVQAMSSSVGFAVGMGGAIGAIVNFAGMCGALILHFAFFGSVMAAHAHDTNPDARTIATSFSVVADFFQIAGAPFVGALLGAFGGLVGGSTVPRSTATARLL